MFALVDCNNFYASCERVFDPTLRRRAIVVLSNNDGCVIARSNEAKVLGFQMGDPYFQVKSRIEQHGVAVFSSNYTLYGDMSRRVMTTLAGFAPEIEEYSIDEAFLNLGGFDVEQLSAHAEDIRRTVQRWTGIPVSVGIGPTKTLAKAANHLAKKTPTARGIWIIADEADRRTALHRLAIGDVWGIGRRWAAKLAASGIATAGDFAERPDRWIREQLSVVGLRTASELRGTPCLAIELAPPPRKGLVVSRMFGRKLTTLAELREPLIAYATRAGEKLRRDRMVARHLQVFLKNSPFSGSEAFYSNAASFQLPHPTSNTAELIHFATAGLEKIFRPGLHYIKCGIMLNQIEPAGGEQRDLFTAGDGDRSRRLMQTLDAINRRMGRNTVFYAGSGIQRRWAAFAAMKSPGFTTRWAEVLRVRV